MDRRYPIYEKADITVLSRDVRKDVITGEVLAAILQHVQSGRLKALAVTSARRIPALPGVPTPTPFTAPKRKARTLNADEVPEEE